MLNRTDSQRKRFVLLAFHRGARQGFTLIEVLVAMGIFAIAILGLAIGATTVMRANHMSYLATVATNLAQDKLEELKARTVTQISACPNNCDNPVPTYNSVPFTRTWAVTPNSPTNGVTRLDVTVQWTDYMQHTVVVSSAVRNSS